MAIEMSRFYQVFFDEASEHLANMESLLLELDVGTPDDEKLNAIFRAAHSIKGGAGTFGFTDMARVTHVLETLLDRLRKHETSLTAEMVDAALQAGDILRSQLEAHQEGAEYQDEERISGLCGTLEELSDVSDAAAEPPAPQPSRPRPGADLPVWQIRFRTGAPGLPAESDLVSLIDALADLGPVERLDPGERDDEHRWQLQTACERDAIVDIFAFVCDAKQIQILTPEEVAEADAPAVQEEDGFGFFTGNPGADAVAPDSSAANADQEGDGFGFFGGSPGSEQVTEAMTEARKERRRGYGIFRNSPGSPGYVVPGAANAKKTGAAAAAKTATPAAGPKRAGGGETSIRVSVEKVDQLINLVGELVITHAMLAQSTSVLDTVTHERVHDGIANLERNSRDLQQAVMSIRMMPISFVFNRFPRVVHDTAASLGKQVTLTLVGEETELDKGLIERLADPLNHLVRNSIDHGIETPDLRLAAGKLEGGEIKLVASHRGGNIVIEIIDDGAGLNREKLLKKAAERGIPMSDGAPDKDVWQLIFAAGFSTADKVTDISGRGVGMDVVRRNIEAMNGRVDIESTAGKGTHITIRLPLTLAILDGMSVFVDQEVFIVPLTAIRESIRPEPGQCKTLAGKGNVVQVGEEYLPRMVLAELFEISGAVRPPEESILVIIDTNEGRAALQVGELGAQLQVVIKSLETNYRKVDGISGATIMGDGRVAMILDVDALVRIGRREH